MKKLALYLAMILAALSSNNSRAAITFTLGGAEVLPGGLRRYTLSFSATTPGGVVAGFQGNFPGNNGFSGGPMNQQLVGGVITTPTTDLNAAIDESMDTQFLVSNADILSAVAPFETPNSLGGAFTLNVAARATTKALVQIVMPFDKFVRLNFGVSEAVGPGSQTTQFNGVLPIPSEPASTTLAGLSLLAALAYRRRTRSSL
jgi:hypothetical protein